MKYTLSKSFVKNTRFKIFGTMVFFASMGMFLTYQGILNLDFKVILGGFLFWIGYSQKTELGYWKNSKDLIYMEIDSKIITVSDRRESRVMDLESVKKVVLQKIHGKVKSIVFHTNDGDIKKLQGFNNMEEMAEKLEEALGESKIKTSSLFHR